MIRPSAMLIAEDHTGWDAVAKLPAQGGLGFDATWDNAFYHNLIGDSDMAGGKARLLKEAGFGGEPAAARRLVCRSPVRHELRPHRIPRIPRRGRKRRRHRTDNSRRRQ